MQHEPPTDATAPVAGVDVSKGRLDLFVDAGDKSLRVANDDAGVAALVAALPGHGARPVVVEATGRYHRRAAAALLRAGVDVAVVNPAHARAFAQAAGRLEKSDRIDAEVPARFGRALGPRLAVKTSGNQALLSDLSAGGGDWSGCASPKPTAPAGSCPSWRPASRSSCCD